MEVCLARCMWPASRTSCAPLVLTGTEFPRARVWSGPRDLALASLRVSRLQALCLVIGSLWISHLHPEQALTKAAVLPDCSLLSETEDLKSSCDLSACTWLGLGVPGELVWTFPAKAFSAYWVHFICSLVCPSIHPSICPSIHLKLFAWKQN